MDYPLILTLDANSQPHAWMHWKDAVTLKCKGLISYEFGDSENTIRGGISRISGERSQIEISSIIALKGKFKYQRRVPALNNKNLFRRDLHTCAYCGRFFTEHNLTRDHIIPTSKNGKDIWTNVVTACKKCNNYKGDKLLQDTDMELLYVPYTPDRAEELILENRKIMSDQMEFLKGFVPQHSRVFQMKDVDVRS